MPKKHTPSYAQTKPSYVHPSLHSSRSPPASPSAPQSVNERLQQLRREQAPRATPERRDEITEVATQRTVPPDLRRILHLPEVDAPRPKRTARAVSRMAALQGGAPRPPPGPAAPSSWAQGTRLTREAKERKPFGRPVGVGLLAKVNDAEFKRLPRQNTLMHHCLKKLAANWQELAEFEQHYLPALPSPLKEALLTYLSIYGGEDCLTLETFKILFGESDEVEGGSSTDDIHFLDLSGMLNPEYTLKDFQKSLQRSVQKSSISGDMSKLSVDVIDSWEDEAERPPILPANLSIPFFPSLTRLSLSHPGSSASWPDLLSVTKHLSTLTHLSLAYWPRPTATPNANTTSMISRHGRPVALGGTHFYSDLDDDWEEASNILRRLSHNTYCLRWLDLEGCTWHRALTWNNGDPKDMGIFGGRVRFEPATTPAPTPTVQWDQETYAQAGPDWAGSWRQITYLNLSQGWIPNEPSAVTGLPAGTLALSLLVWLREHKSNPRYKDRLRRADTRDGAVEWMEREKHAKRVAERIMIQRKRGKVGEFCRVEYGWDPYEKAPPEETETEELFA